MKKRLLTYLLMVCLLLTMAGCSAAGVERTLDRAEDRLDAAEDRLENRIDAVEDSVENAVRQTMAPAQRNSTPSVQTQITREEAEKIALDHVGLTADQVTGLRTESEIDDGMAQYDVSFFEGNWEYEFEIEAATGRILSFDKDSKWD